MHLVSFLWDKTKQGTFIHEPRSDLRFFFPLSFGAKKGCYTQGH